MEATGLRSSIDLNQFERHDLMVYRKYENVNKWEEVLSIGFKPVRTKKCMFI